MEPAMNLLAHPPKPDRQPRLGAADWIEVALQSLVSGGIEAVQITALARTLKVTRGSFYWHFETRDDLLAALIQEWRARNTDVIVEAISDVPTLDEGILELFAVWVDHTRFDPALDGAIRAWAKHDRSEEHTSELQSLTNLVCRLLLEKKKKRKRKTRTKGG